MQVNAGQKLFAIDIETASQGKRAKDYTDQMPVKAPSNYKDPEKIEAYKEAERKKLSTKHGLNWWTGKIISVAVIDVISGEEHLMYGHDEENILVTLGEYLRGNKLVGKTSKNFDFPFLLARYMANGIKVPTSLKNRNNMYDVDDLFGLSMSSGQRGKLDAYAHGLNLPSKPLEGSMVQSMYDTILLAEMEGDTVAANATWKELTDYNLHDTRIVASMVKLYGVD